MKNHAIIPIFIPHYGCNYECVFCNQNEITGHDSAPTYGEVKSTIDTWLTTLRASPEQKSGTVEIAFYGGSFTGIPIRVQSAYLGIAKEYKDKGFVDKIHLSTRPDYIDNEILANLKAYGVDIIELGVQSFDNGVLKASNRGHDAECVYHAANLIKKYGFELGIQLMIGLPEDTMETCVYSAEKTVELKPALARIYPTILLENTELLNMYKCGEYTPLSRDEAVRRAKAMYLILDDAGITIMRVGLKSGDIMDNAAIDSPAYHPAFRQLVESEIAKDRIEDLVKKELEDIKYAEIATNTLPKMLDIFSSPSWFSNMIGNKGSNKKFFKGKYPNLKIKFRIDKSLEKGKFRIEFK